jgi:hypothetical protein
MANTTIEMEILEDGTISIKTSDISEANHISADELLNEIAQLTGGQRSITSREHPFWKNRNVQLHGKIVKVGG